MSRIASVMSNIEQEGRKALIPYITGGDPKPDWTVDIMHALVDAGADLIELGIPFSDPMADGPVIQLACERALEHGTSLTDVLGMVEEFRKTDTNTPVVLMGYLNPLERMGYKAFAAAASKAGVDGVLTVDLPPEEADSLVPLLSEQELDAIFLIAPTTTDARIDQICRHSSGYVYYVSVKGVTGSASLDEDEVSQKVAKIKELSQVPVGVGFGIKDPESAANVAKLADGVIVGSVLVNMIDKNSSELDKIKFETSSMVSAMRSAIDSI